MIDLGELYGRIAPKLKRYLVANGCGELPVAEIARRTNATENLVKVRIYRAKEKLRPLLKDLL